MGFFVCGMMVIFVKKLKGDKKWLIIFGLWYGFIDINGDEVIPFEYDYCNSFSDGLARAKRWDDWFHQ